MIARTRTTGFAGVLIWLTGLVGLPVSMAGEEPQASASLNEVCVVEYRGTFFVQALKDLAGRTGAPYILDESIDEEVRNRPIRMSASHLRGAQAFRWLARSAGVSAAFVDGTFFVADTSRLPLIWQSRMPEQAIRPVDQWADAGSRRATVTWTDAPLASVAKDISRLFSVDVIFHPEVLADQGLIHHRAEDASLAELVDIIADQLEAKVEFTDGAVWVFPVGHAAERGATTAPADHDQGSRVESRISEDTGKGSSPRDGGLNRRLRIDADVRSWSEFADRVGRASGRRCELIVPVTPDYPGIQARGSVAGILEAARLLGWLTWRVDDGQDGTAGRLIIEVRERAS